MVGILKIFEKSLGIGLLLTFIFSFTGFANNCDNLSSKVLRLHILANSDSKADQELKIKVRDKIIEKSVDFLNGATDKVSAQNLTAENLENIKKIATTDTILNDSEKDIINSDEKYEIKFKMVEYFYAIKNVILNWFK